ncbi:MAG: protein kinase, partial [Candidatus Promineifilaceae bacterium]|nr:protein kinase [Candidatus Promineifilaceae bacterium]
MTQLQLRLLGPPQVKLGHQPVDIDGLKPAALVFYLAVTAEPQPRDSLATLFWPENDQSQARAYLRRAIWSLKQAGLDPFLQVDREQVGLGEDWGLDVAAFRQALAAGQTAQAVALYRDDFLTGFTLPDCPAFDDWHFYEAQALRSELAAALSELVQEHARQGDFAPAVEYALRWLNLDPLQEAVHRHLMRLYAYQGQHGAALRQYESCATLLEEELGVEPEVETQQLRQAIQDRRLVWQPRPTVGTTLNERYRLVDLIGRGAMGVVYRANDTLLERQVAVKLIDADAAGEPQRLLREAQAAARLNHAHIVAVHDAGSHHGLPYIVMELIEGSSLRALERPDLETLWGLAEAMAAALDHAHKQGIVHRDLKPENVLVTTAGQPKLADFGLAQVANRSRLTQGKNLMGTLSYLAPELIMGQPASAQSDLYALGVIVYELATGRPPFEGDNAAVLLTNHLHAPVVPPSAYRPDLSPGLEALIIELLAKEPEQRPPGAAAVLARLERLRGHDEPPPEPVATQTPTTTLLDRIARGRLVGRTRELGEATDMWLRAMRGRGGLLLLSGEPGIGKTRLAQALIAQAEASGAVVLRGGCYEFEASAPYLPVAEALRDWVRSATEQVLDEAMSDLSLELKRLVPEIGPRLANGPVDGADARPQGQSLGVEEEQHQLFDAVARFLERLASERGVLLFLDDLHWADQGTLSLLSYLVRRLADSRLLLVGAYRELELDRAHPLAEALVDWNRARLAHRLQLSRFDRAGTQRLIAALFGQESVSSPFAEVIHRETEGNPFFVEEVLKALVEQGQIYWVDDHWERAALEELSVPQSIKEAIGGRLSRLSLTCQDTLHAAAVIGKDFDFALLAEVARLDDETLLDALDEALAAQLLRSGQGDRFIFTHDKIREVLYQEQLTVRRKRLHLRIVAALESAAGDDPAGQAEALAYHTIAAGDFATGLRFARLAAEKAERLNALEEARLFYRQALDCALTLEDRAAETELTEALADTLRRLGQWEEAAELFERAIALAPPAEHGRLKARLGLNYTTVNDERGVPLLHEALAQLDAEQEPLAVAEALGSLGRFHHLRAEYRRALELYRRALALAEPQDDARILHYLYTYMAGPYARLLNIPESNRWAQASIDLGRRHNNRLAEASGHEYLAENYIILGRWRRALEHAQKEIGLVKEQGYHWRLAWAYWCEAIARWGLGQLADSRAGFVEARHLASDLREERLLVLINAYAMLNESDLGEKKSLQAERLSTLEQARQMGDPEFHCTVLWCSAYSLMHEGDYEQGLELLQKSARIYNETELVGTDLEQAGLLADTLVHVGAVDEAEVALANALDLARDHESRHYEGVAL